jgi:7-cyano-7-deazaguanine synthase
MGGKAVCLISGGLDSAVCAGVAKDKDYLLYALTFDYGQRHKKEIESAKRIGRHYGVLEHKILDVDLKRIGGSALTDNIEVPKGKTIEQIRQSAEIPATYVPARNTIFLAYALAYAETVGADEIIIGANHMDYSGYPDCRPEYYGAFERLAHLATKRAVEGAPVIIRTPLLDLNKKEIIMWGLELKVPFELTWSCYSGGERACGVCDSCVLRLNGFKEARAKDPLEYETR